MAEEEKKGRASGLGGEFSRGSGGGRARVLNSYTPEIAPAEAAPKDKPLDYDPLEFLENTYKSFANVLRGIVHSVVLAPQSAYELFDKGLYKELTPSNLWEYKGEVAPILRDVVVSPQYKEKGIARTIYEDPAVPLLDLLTILTLGGGATAKMGAMTERAAKASKVLRHLEKPASKVARAGRAMEMLPGEVAAKVYDQILRKTTGMSLRERATIKSIQRSEVGEASKRIIVAGEPIAKELGKMTSDEWATLDRILHRGGTADELAAFPRVQKTYELLDEWVAGTREKFIANTKHLTPKKMENAVIRKLAVEMFENEFVEAGKITRNMLEKARVAYKNLEVKPIYTPGYHAKVGFQNRLARELFGQDPISRLYGKGNVAFFKMFRGSTNRIKDPRKYIPRMIEEFEHFRADVQFLDRVIKDFGVRASKQAQASRVQGGIIARHFGGNREGFRAAQTRFVQDLLDIHKDPKIVARLLKEDTKVQQAMSQMKSVVFDKGIRRFLDAKYSQLGGPLGRIVGVYDRILSLFRASATVLNPRWYTGNVFGDGLLSILANGMGGKYRNVGDIIKIMPSAQSMGRTGLAAEAGIRSLMSVPFVRNFPQLVEHVDAAARAGIISNAIRRQLKRTGKKFFKAQESVDEAVLRIAGAEAEYARVMHDNAVVMGDIAQNSAAIGTMTAKINKLEKVSARSFGQLQKLADNMPGSGRAWQARLARERQIQRRIEALEARSAKSMENIPKGSRAKWRRAEKKAELDAQIERLKVQKIVAIRNVPRSKQAFLNRQKKIKGLEKVVASSRQEAIDIAQKRANALADFRDTYRSQEVIHAQIPELKQLYEQVIMPAVERANTFVGDYNGLGPIEQKLLRRVIPFYSWVKAMNKLAFKLPVIAPGSAFLWHRYSQFLWSQIGDEELPGYMKNSVPTFVRENGDIVWLNLNSLSPFNSLRMSRFFDKPIPGAFAIWEGNPLVNLAYRGAGGKTPFMSSSIPYGEAMAMIGNGDHYRYTGNGEVEKVIPQAPLVASLAHFFPVVQSLEQLLYRHRMTHDGWLLNPDPVLNKDGSYRYPTEWLQSIVTYLGPRVSIRSRESLIRAERFRIRQVLNELKSEYRRAAPGRREYIRGVFEDYSKYGKFRVKYD